MKNFEDITFSIVSHNQQDDCIKAIKSFREAFPKSKFIVTLNTSEKNNICKYGFSEVKVIRNQHPIGFGENHNNAFKFCKSDYFCVLNPDTTIRFLDEKFNLDTIFNSGFKACSPLIFEDNKVADGLRAFPAISSFIKRFLFSKNIDSIKPRPGKKFDWMSGACIIFPKEVFYDLGGFDTSFFMYCEDIDLFRRMSISNYNFCCSIKFQINHESNRQSRRKINLLLMHINNAIKIVYRLNFKGKKINKGIVI